MSGDCYVNWIWMAHSFWWDSLLGMATMFDKLCNMSTVIVEMKNLEGIILSYITIICPLLWRHVLLCHVNQSFHCTWMVFFFRPLKYIDNLLTPRNSTEHELIAKWNWFINNCLTNQNKTKIGILIVENLLK